MGVFRKKRGVEGLDVARCWEKGLRGGRLRKMVGTTPRASGGPLSSGSRWSLGSPKIQVKGILVAKKRGIRVVYLKFEGFWVWVGVSLICPPMV